MAEERCLIDGFGPVAVERPTCVAGLSDAVRRAAAAQQAVYPLGGRTRLDLGLPPARPGRGLDLRGLAEVQDYPARDMTITVQAGITLTRLQSVLAGEQQRLPVDVPRADEATLGGALATNTSGPRRLSFGTLRDYVIGITTVNDEGQETKAGGRVVKNVAGYDLCKLHVGALGTLGVISQVTLKLRPRPEEQALVTVGVSAAALPETLERLHASRTRPVCLELLNAAAARRASQQAGVAWPAAEWVIVVGYEENRTAVAWQVQQLLDELPAGPPAGLDTRVGFAAESLWRALTELTLPTDAAVSFKATLLPHALPDFCRQAAASLPDVLLQARAGNGIVLGHLSGSFDTTQVAGWLAPLRQAAVAAEGNLTITRCPAAWKRELPVWGEPRGDLWLMRRVRDALDPRRLFNPGRFLE